MASNPLNTLVQQLRAAVERDGAGRSDGELLTRFLSQRDHDALAALVRRHAPMVWGVCRRILRSHHDAEDAFQATFIVLVRKAATIVPREMVPNWLHGVAQQTAVRLRATAAKRGMREMQSSDIAEVGAAEVRDDELLSLLDQELSRLPERSRALIVLCDLEGKSRKEAARQLGCPEGTVASGLARARQLLAKRMTRHGPAVSGVALAAALAHSVASASVPSAMVNSTIHVATSVAAGTAVGVISGPVAALTEQVLKAMFLKKLTTTTILMAALAMAAITFGSLAIGQTEGDGKPKDQQPAREKPVDAPAKQPEKEPFTAWGKEVGGLQAGLGFPLGENRVYRHRESVKLVLRVRNVSKEPVDFRYIWAFFGEHPPTITDPDGQRIPLPRPLVEGEHAPRSVKLAAGQAVELYDWDFDLRPKEELGTTKFVPIHGTGKFNIRCERVVGPTSANLNDPDPALDKLATGTLELDVRPAAANAEKEPFTAWGKEVGGLQAGLGFPLGAHRAYRLGEAVDVVVRVRNVSNEAIDFRYIRAFFFENTPTVTDANGRRISLLKLTADGRQFPRDAKLAPGQAADIFDWSVNLLPEGDSGTKGSYAIHGTGKFSLQCERVVGPTLSNPKHPDPARDKLATGKLELEVEPAAANAEKEPFTAWGKEIGGLQAGLGFRPGEKRAYRHGESVKLVLRVRNVSKETVDFSYIWAFYIENPPTIADPDGQRIQLPKYAGLGLQDPRVAKLAPGKDVEIFDWDLDLRPKGESGRKGVLTIHGTGMFSLQCERVVGPTSANPNHPDPTRDKLATGKLELEIAESPGK